MGINNLSRAYSADVETARTAANKLVSDGILNGPIEAHHVTPFSVANESDFIAAIYDPGEYAKRVGDTGNILLMSRDADDAKALGISQHRGNHNGAVDGVTVGYRDAVRRIHEELFEEYNTAIEGKNDAEIVDISKP